jgi:hypothetical protein
MSVRPHGTTRLPWDGFEWNLIYKLFSKICRKKLKCRKNLTRITGPLHEDILTFMTISRWILLTMRNVLDRSCKESQITHFMFSNVSQLSCGLWDNVERYSRAREAANDNKIWRMRGACWISKARRAHMPTPTRPLTTHVHTYACARAPAHTEKYVILIVFALQKWLNERTSM